jgi:hypothetical protein
MIFAKNEKTNPLADVIAKQQVIDRYRNGNRTPTINSERNRIVNFKASNTSRFFNSGIKKDRDQISGCVKLDTQQSLGELRVSQNQINLM